MATEAELKGMSRAELDELAKDEHLDPDDYSNKDELVAALAELEDETDDEKRERLESRRDELKKANGKKKQRRVVDTTEPGALDRMITDPVGAQQERFEGTTSDASTRTEGTRADEVPPDPSEGTKPSDEEDYDYPPQGDVDISTVEIIEADGERLTKPTLEDWVVLDGSHEQVPDALDGRRAVILNVHPENAWDERDLLKEDYVPEDVSLTVRTRDDYSATLYLPLDALKEIQRRGVSPMRT
jgi:hypothetical protein